MARLNCDEKLVEKFVVEQDEVKRFLKDVFRALKLPEDHVEIFAETLLMADMRGYMSHGMNRLARYVMEITSGTVDPRTKGQLIFETPALTYWDGENGLGPVIGRIAMDKAIAKAKEVGIGITVVKGANHFGICSMYSLQALKEDCIGIVFTNSCPLSVPTRAKSSVLGTNPISFAAPGKCSDSLVLDFATTNSAVGQVELKRKKNEKCPDHWAINEKGEVETDPEVIMNNPLLLPLGGTEENGGYKGYCMSFLVELLSGILAGANYGHKVRKYRVYDTIANLGQSFIAISPKMFEPGYEDRMTELNYRIRMMEPADPDLPVIVGGDPERANLDEIKKNGGITYIKAQFELCQKVAKDLGVCMMDTID